MTEATEMPAILGLRFPFDLKKDQIEAVDAWVQNGCRGSVIFSTGTGKTEIAFECARRAAQALSPPEERLLEGTSRQFRVLFLVPRIVLIEQNLRRLRNYGIADDCLGVYYGEKKNASEITISTYQSAINNREMISDAHMVVLDEVHLISETASEFDKIFDILVEDPRKAILGLTATIDERDPKYQTILTVLPPVKKYHIKDAVDDGRLAKPVLKPIEVRFNPEEQEKYDQLTANIKEISRKLQAYDPIRMTRILGRGGPRATLAKAWFASVRERKNLLSSTELKLRKAVEVVKSHPGERIMIFSETIDSIELLRTILEQEGIRARSIHNGIKPRDRHEILASWGEDYFPLLSVHTLEIGYDVPQAGIAIIIASTSNMNQVAQRIGRVVRISEGKDHALVYVIYVAGSKDTNVLKVMSAAIEKRGLTAPSAGVKADKPAAKPRPVRGQKTLTKFS